MRLKFVLCMALFELFTGIRHTYLLYYKLAKTDFYNSARGTARDWRREFGRYIVDLFNLRTDYPFFAHYQTVPREIACKAFSFIHSFDTRTR